MLLRRSGVLNGRSAGLQRAVDELRSQQSFDVIVLSTTLLGYLDLPRDVPVIGDTHNVEFDNLGRAASRARSIVKRQFLRLEQSNTKREELAFTRRCNAVWTSSSRDRDILRRHVSDVPIEVIANGVDIPPVCVSEPRKADALVFVGLMRYAPNIEGVRWFLDYVFPIVRLQRPCATFTIVGANPIRSLRRLRIPGVRVTGTVAEVAPFLRRSTVFVAPIWSGGGMRGKIVEAMAYSCPVVSTTIGCEGMDLTPGEHALIADAPEDFAKAVVDLLLSTSQRLELARRAHQQVVERFQWSHIGAKAARCIAQVAARRGDS